MKLLTYYDNVITTVGLTHTTDMFLSIAGEDKIKYKGVPIALPTKTHMNTLKSLNKETMEMEISKHIFNPLAESTINGVNPGMTVLINKIDYSISVGLEMLIKYMVQLIINKELQTNLSPILLNFMNELSSNYSKKTKVLFSKDTEKNIDKLLSNKKIKLIHSKFMKDEKLEGKLHKYILEATLPLYEKINRPTSMKMINKNKNIEGSPITPSKDLPILRSIYEYVFDTIELTYTTNNTSSPTYRMYMEYWLTVYGRFNKLFKALQFINEEDVGAFIVNMEITKKEITTAYLKRFETELNMYSKDTKKELTPVYKKKKTKVQVDATNRTMNTGDKVIVNNDNIIETKPITPTNKKGVISTSEYLAKLKSGNIGNQTTNCNSVPWGNTNKTYQQMTPQIIQPQVYGQQQIQPNMNPYIQQQMTPSIQQVQQPYGSPQPYQQTQQLNIATPYGATPPQQVATVNSRYI